jgi:trigger factor
MARLMEAQVEKLEGDRVRLTVEVPADDVHHAVTHATNDLAENVRIPGFRKGKVPTPVLVSRVGKERIYSEAVESHIGSWFWTAARRSRVRPTEQPAYQYELPKADDESWRFTAEFAVQGKPEPADWTGLEVPKHDVEVDSEIVDDQLEQLQRMVAELSPVDGRPAQEGDVAVVDIVSEDGPGQRDYVIEIGAERLADEIEQGLIGLSTGESRPVSWQLAEGVERRATVTLKDLREKVLPPLDDSLATTASEFDTLDELRGDVEERIRQQLEDEANAAFRAAAVDELVKASNVQPAGLVVEVRTRELLNSFLHSLESRGIDPAVYLQMTGVSPDQLERRLRAEAAQSIARELVLEAVADKLGIEVDDEGIRAQLREQGETDEDIEEFIAAGGADRVRQDLRMKSALDRIAAEVKPMPPELAAAREKIWTPEQDRAKQETKLWTPGSAKE